MECTRGRSASRADLWWHRSASMHMVVAIVTMAGSRLTVQFPIASTKLDTSGLSAVKSRTWWAPAVSYGRHHWPGGSRPSDEKQNISTQFHLHAPRIATDSSGKATPLLVIASVASDAVATARLYSIEPAQVPASDTTRLTTKVTIRHPLLHGIKQVHTVAIRHEMTRPKVPPDQRQRTAQACESCKRRKQKARHLSIVSQFFKIPNCSIS